MTAFAAIMLFISAAFSFIVWPQFFKRIAADPRSRDESGARTPFFNVHAILISTALLIALVSAVAGICLLVA